MKLLDQEYFQLRKDRFGILPPDVISSTISEILLRARKELNKPINQLTVLDVGCGKGEYSFEIEKYVKRVVGVEPYKPIYQESIRLKKILRTKSNILNCAIENFKTKEKFDLVLSLTTIEHMPNARKSFEKIFSLLKEGGIIYLTAPNKLWPIEQHYNLPFLSWVPLSVANLYLKFSGKGESFESCSYSKTYWGMKRFFNQFPCRYKFVMPLNKNAAYLGIGQTGFLYKIIKDLGISLISRFHFFWALSKGFILIIKKAKDNEKHQEIYKKKVWS